MHCASLGGHPDAVMETSKGHFRHCRFYLPLQAGASCCTFLPLLPESWNEPECLSLRRSHRRVTSVRWDRTQAERPRMRSLAKPCP